MTVTAIGEIELGVAIPGVQAALAISMADIEAKVAAFAEFRPTPPSLQASVTLAADMLKGLELAVSIGIEPPSLDAQITIMLAQLGLLKAQLAVLLELYNTLKAAVHLYKYEGPTSDFGTEMQAEIGGGLPGGAGSDSALALTLIATAAVPKVALQAVFKVDP